MKTVKAYWTASDRRRHSCPTVKTEMWSYQSGLYAGDIEVVGYNVEAIDGGIGKVDDATYDAGSSYVVVDTGPWIFGKVMLPRRRHRSD